MRLIKKTGLSWSLWKLYSYITCYYYLQCQRYIGGLQYRLLALPLICCQSAALCIFVSLTGIFAYQLLSWSFRFCYNCAGYSISLTPLTPSLVVVAAATFYVFSRLTELKAGWDHLSVLSHVTQIHLLVLSRSMILTMISLVTGNWSLAAGQLYL